MIITDNLIDYNEHSNDIQILLGGGDGNNDPADLTKVSNPCSHALMRMKTARNG